MSDIASLDAVERSIVRWLAELLESGRLSIEGPELGERLRAEGAGDRFIRVFKHLEALGLLEPRYDLHPYVAGTFNAFAAERLGRGPVTPLTWTIAYGAIELRDAMQREAGGVAAGCTSDQGEAGQGEGAKRKGKRGRQPDTDPKADQRVADAWGTGRYRTYEDCARALGVSKKQVKDAIDRHRHRSPGKRRRRTEAPE
jgi:hypothetical protein